MQSLNQTIVAVILVVAANIPLRTEGGFLGRQAPALAGSAAVGSDAGSIDHGTDGGFLGRQADALAGSAAVGSDAGSIDNGTEDPPNTQKLDIPFTPPDQALKMLTLPKGFNATLFAAEPDVHQPIAVTTDYRGRLWVVECYTYSDGKTNYDMSLNDRVVIFEDEDNDGRFDKKTVFWDQGKKLTGIELGYGGVWLTAAPDFIFIPDRDGDDQPDGPPQILLDGFEDDTIRHNIVNGLRWGPDGWLYGRHGIQATSNVGTPGATASQRVPMNCAIWRFHPVHKKFEVVAEGGTNPWGFDYDEYGEMFMINTVIGHLFHIVPGARYRRMYGSHFNPHTYQVIEQTANHFHWDRGEPHTAASKVGGLSLGTDAAGGGHAHTGLMIYQGGNWPTRYHNTLFTANFHGRRINNDFIQRAGNSYIGLHTLDFMKTDDPWFRGIELIYGSDGGVYILDWSDIGECHENDGIHRTSGRIFKVVFGDSHVEDRLRDLEKLDDNELVDLFSNRNMWYFRKAHRLLIQRAIDQELVSRPELVRRLQDICIAKEKLPREHRPSDEALRLRALWTLYAMSEADEGFLLKCTESKGEHLRSWAVRFLADGLTPVSPTLASRFVDLAHDPSGLVRLYVASALARFNPQGRLAIAAVLAGHASDADDRVQPHLIWFGIEPVVVSNWKTALQIACDSAIPLLRENIIRRLTDEIESNPAVVETILAEIQSGKLETDSALRGMSLSLDGRTNVSAPSNWQRVAKYLTQTDRTLRLETLAKLGVVFGDGRAVADLKTMALSNELDVAIRRRAIESWAATKPADLPEILTGLLRDRALTSSVLRAMVHSVDDNIAHVIINQMPYMDPDGRSTAINTLVSREPWALSLLDAVEKRRIDVETVTAYHAGRIMQFDSDQVRKRLEDVWGKIRATPTEKREEIRSLATQVVADDGAIEKFDGQAGRKLFEMNCASCHTLFGQGGKTGPDLTGANRQNLNYLLTNIIDPSGSVAETYRSSIIKMEDGRLISGLILNRDEKKVQIQTPQQVINIERESIEAIRQTDRSVMPDGLLNNMSIQQKTNLLGYLMSPIQVSKSD